MRIGLGVATVALVMVSACGGSGDSPEPARTGTPSATPTLGLFTAAQACAQVELINEKVGGPPGNWPIPTYEQFSEDIASVAEESEPTVSDPLRTLSTQSDRVGSMEGDEDNLSAVTGLWGANYQTVADICARTDSPIARLEY